MGNGQQATKNSFKLVSAKMGMNMETTTPPRGALLEIVDALENVVDGSRIDELETFYPKSSSDSMNIDPISSEAYTAISSPAHHVPERAPSSSPPSPRKDMISQMIPSMLRSTRGLVNVPHETLRSSLEPIINALRNLDAELLLSLEASPVGPRVREGRHCRPIYDDVKPAIASNDASRGQSCVRYLHIAELPEQYSMGVFVFAPYSRIPLHDHPEMCVLSRVLYGDLQRVSLDLDREEITRNGESGHSLHKRGSWLESVWNRKDSQRQKLPEGAKHAFKNKVDYLQAPDVTALYPYEGNLHEFVAGPNGAAVLDVLLPPYDNSKNRDCTFYEIQEATSAYPKPSEKEPCIIVPTGQPENFHCISGQYRDIGEAEDYD